MAAVTELKALVAQGLITAQAARSLLRQGYTPAQIVRSVIVPAVAP